MGDVVSGVVVEHEQARPHELDGEVRAPARRLEFTIEPGAIKIHHDSQHSGDDA